MLYLNLKHFKHAWLHAKLACATVILVFIFSFSLFSAETKTTSKPLSTIKKNQTTSNKQKATNKKPRGNKEQRLLGNTAFDSGLYDVAMEYYKNYLKDAKEDTPAVRDAYYCLIATCLRANNIDEAKKLHNELATKFLKFFKTNTDDKKTLDYWNGEILLKEGNFKKAEELFGNILKNPQPNSKDLISNTLTGLGIIKIRQQKWEKAKTIFLKLQNLSVNKKTTNFANEQLVLINIVLGNIEEAKHLIHTTTTDKRQLTTKFRILQVYTLINENKYSKALQSYKQLKGFFSPSNTLWYIMARTLANSFIKNKQYEKAIPLLKDSIIASPNSFTKKSLL